MMTTRTKLSFLVVFLLSLAPAFAVNAQNVPATPVAGDAPEGILAEFEIGTLPTPHAEVWFMRIELAPGGSIPRGSNPGPAILYIERGTLLAEVGGPVVPTTPGDPNTGELTLEVGDSILVPRDVGVETRNTGDEPVTFLMLLMYSGMEEGMGDSSTADPVGMSQAGISVGTAEFFPSPATVAIERVVIQPGESLQNVDLPGLEPGPIWMGMDLGMVETGSASLDLQQLSFSNLVWRSISGDEMVRPVRIPFTASTTLEQGQGYAAFGSVVTFTNTGDEPLTILRVIITPQMGE